MRYRDLCVAAVILFGSPQAAMAQAGAWSVPGEPLGGRKGQSSQETRTWNLETLRLDTRPIAELLRSGYQVISVELNYLSGVTEMFLYDPKGKPQFLHCLLKGQKSTEEQMSVATRCMGF